MKVIKFTLSLSLTVNLSLPYSKLRWKLPTSLNEMASLNLDQVTANDA